MDLSFKHSVHSKPTTMNSKVLIAAIVGGIFFFLLGWLIFGVLLAGSMEDGMNESMKLVYREMDAFVYWAMGLSNFLTALLLALILNRFGVNTFMKGAVAGLWIGLLVVLAYDFSMYAQTTMYDMNIILMDAGMSAIMTALVAGVIGFMLGRGKKTATA
jgi:hypothetical protein